MNRLSIATLVLVSCATAAFATADVMAGFYGNTLVSTGGHAEIHTHYRADHSFDLVASMMGMSRTFKGTWAADDKGNICRTYIGKVPPDSPNPLCMPLPPHKAGDTWIVTVNGDTRTLTLKAGIQ